MSQDPAEMAYTKHVAETVGWTEFAKTHTQISGAQHKAAFMAGYTSALTDVEGLIDRKIAALK